ncbi:MAG: glycosyltransferase family 39 protein [Candidatus Roizmanbacteria bacterium]
MSNKKIFLFLMILLIFSFSLRVYKIGSRPTGILPDEASFGYNAYSVFKTGKDEHGVFFPLMFKAFGDEKLPVYAYSTIPIIKVFGLNNFAIRLPSAIAGTLITLFMFFLLLEFGLTIELSFVGALIAATSQWSIILSRFSFESNFGLLFFILGILFSFISYKKNKLLPTILAGVFFGLTWYSYTTYRLITPVILLGFIIIYMKNKKFINKYGIVLFISFIITISPLILSTFSNQGQARFKQAVLNSNLGTILEINESRAFCTQYLPKIICYANANKIIFNTRNLFYRYINTFSPDYLFMTGDKNSKYLNVDNFGLLPIVLLPFYFVGIIYLWNLFIKQKLSKNELFIILGLIITPLPTLLVGDPQKIRLSALLPFLIILIIYGFYHLESYLKKSISNKIYLGMITFLIVFCLFFMINYLTIHVQKYEITYGTYVPKLMNYLSQQKKETSIYIRSITESIVLYAYVNKVNPNIFQKTVIRQKPDAIGFVHATDLGNLHVTGKSIEEIYCQSKKDRSQSLYVTNENYVMTGKVKKAAKIIWSENGVDTLALVYNVKDINEENIDCTKIR